MNHPDRNAARPVVLIVLKEVLVGQDLAQAVRDERPDARVVIAQTPEAALSAIDDEARVEIAFVAAEPQVFERSSLVRGLTKRGARVVMLGVWTDPAALPGSWTLLPFPFTTEDVRALIPSRVAAWQTA